METVFEFKGEEIINTNIELLVKILATNQAILSMLCNKNAKTRSESDFLYQDVMDESNEFGEKILNDLYERRGSIEV